MKRERILETEVRRYLALQRTAEVVEKELEVLKNKWINLIPSDGFRLSGIFKICHKTGRRKSIAWKQEFLAQLGKEAVKEVSENAEYGEPSHSIKISERIDVDNLRKEHRVPRHIPDEQIGDYAYLKNLENAKVLV